MNTLFGLQKEAEIYCTSTKVALQQNYAELTPMINDMAMNLNSTGAANFDKSVITKLIATWAEQNISGAGGNINDEESASWWIGILIKSYMKASQTSETFDELFKESFIKYFKDK